MVQELPARPRAQSFLKSDLHAGVSSEGPASLALWPHLAAKVRLSSSSSADACRVGYACEVIAM